MAKPLPFRFTHLQGSQYVATNLAGEYMVLDRSTIEQVIKRTLNRAHPQYEELLSRHFIYEDVGTSALEVLTAR